MLLNKSGGKINFMLSYRRLSSFNNNKTKYRILSILNNYNNVDLNIWSEHNWSELAKQFNKPNEFPLPGQVGILTDLHKETNINLLSKQQQEAELNINNFVISENLNYLLIKPLPIEIQAIKIKEAFDALYYQKKMENSLLNLEKLNIKKNLFELKSFKCPLSLLKDFQNYFRLNSLNENSLTLMTISFKSENDMAIWNEQVDIEREVLIKKFVDTAQELCNILENENFWADFIDPSSGRPYKSLYTHATFYETDERYRQLGFEIIDYGCCKTISHHKWGTKTYVGCLITSAPVDSKLLKSLTEQFNI